MQEEITIVVPISRREYLKLFFTSLELLKCDPTRTNILAIIDGDDSLYVDVRNYVEMSRFNEKLTIRFESTKKSRLRSERRKRIADIHNFAKTKIKECKYVFLLEDDTIVGPNALQQLLSTYRENPYAGLVSGLELGRYTSRYIGAWNMDDIYEPTKVESLMPEDSKKAVVDVDATGLYCLLTRRDTYVNHSFEDFENGAMGPDVNFGVANRREGLRNLVDWRVGCVHIDKNGKKLSIIDTKPQRVEFVKKNEEWLFFEK